MPKNPTKYIVVDENDSVDFVDMEQLDTVEDLYEAVEDQLEHDPEASLSLYKIQKLNFKSQAKVVIDGLPKPKSECDEDDD